jgi:hypothetical protein
MCAWESKLWVSIMNSEHLGFLISFRQNSTKFEISWARWLDQLIGRGQHNHLLTYINVNGIH